MKTSKYVSTIFLFLIGSALSLQAQDTVINRSISVEREFRPVIHDAGKINSTPQVLEPNVVKSPANYSNFNLPLNAEYNIHILPAADLAIDKPLDISNGYARLGFGNYLNTLADFAYPFINTPDIRLDFSLNHLATFEEKRMHTTTRVNLSFDKIFKTFNLYAGVGGGHEYFKYYGNQYNSTGSITDLRALNATYPDAVYVENNRQGMNNDPQMYSLTNLANDSTGDTFWRFNLQAGVRSLPSAAEIRYQAEMRYQSFKSINGLTEHMVHTTAGFSSPNDKNRLGLDLDMYNMMYSSVNIPLFNYWDNYTVLTLNPYYNIERPEYNVRLGIKTSLSFVHGRFISPSADVRGEWRIIPEYLSLYGGLTGDYDVNTLDKAFSENPYMYSDLRPLDTYTPVDFFAGIKLKPLYNMLLDAYIDYKQLNNQYFFVNKAYSLVSSSNIVPAEYNTLYTNRFNLIYCGASQLKMGFRAAYNYKKLVNVEMKWAYNGWKADNQLYAWNKPKYDAQLNTDVHINENLMVSANMYYEGVRFARLGNVAIPMNDKIDINLGISYSYNNWLTVFGKINNVINNQYQNYYGYDVQGTNMMVGATFSF